MTAPRPRRPRALAACRPALLTLGIASTALACDRSKAPPDALGPSAHPSDASEPVAAPTSSRPAPRNDVPAQVGECPVRIVPGQALGPIRIGDRAEDLGRTALPVKSVSKYQSSEILEVGRYRVETCGGVVHEAWIEDLRVAPDCVTVAGKPVDRQLSRQDFTRLFQSCADTPPRIGGSFTRCEDGGIFIGYGMGDFIQVRVAKKGFQLDDDCEHVQDDGTPVPVPSDTLASLLQQTLDLDRLAPFWHPDQPGRDPLRVVRNDVTQGSPKLTMFGATVVWIDPAQAKKDNKPFFEFTRLRSTATRIRIEFGYPIEGVVGHVVFRKRGDQWRLEEKEVAER